MQMKYFQAVADIKHHYDDILYNLNDGDPIRLFQLKTWCVNPEDKDAILEEYEAIRYLLDCRFEIAHETDAHKPSIEVMNRCLERQLRFLETVHRCHAYNVNRHPYRNIRNQYKACRHYLFKFSLPAWYDKLPDKILTFEEKWA